MKSEENMFVSFGLFVVQHVEYLVNTTLLLLERLKRHLVKQSIFLHSYKVGGQMVL